MNLDNGQQSKEGRPAFALKKSTIWAFLSFLLFKIVLDLSYYLVISQVGYPQLDLHLNSLKLVESYLLLFVILIFMPKSPKKLSNILVWLLILISYIPMLTLFAFKDEPRIFMYGVTAFWVLVFLLLHMPSISLAPLKQSGIIRYSLFVCVGLIVFLMVYKYLGLSFSFDLTKVYGIRSQYAATGVPLAGYLFNWMAYIVNPIFFALFIRERKWLPVALIVVLQMLLFSVTGIKVYLFALPFVLALMWIITRRNPLAYMGLGLAGAVLVSTLSYWLIDDLWVSALFTRRVLMVPAQLSFSYYDFFSQNELVYLSASRLGFFLDYPYHLAPGHLIGEVYFGRPIMNAGTGLTADAYMNFGFVGLALWSVLLAVILKLVDTCSRRVDFRVAIAAIAIPAIILVEAPLTTALLTHGLLLALLVLYLSPREDNGHPV
jgi:hypothetical protein